MVPLGGMESTNAEGYPLEEGQRKHSTPAWKQTWDEQRCAVRQVPPASSHQQEDVSFRPDHVVLSPLFPLSMDAPFGSRHRRAECGSRQPTSIRITRASIVRWTASALLSGCMSFSKADSEGTMRRQLEWQTVNTILQVGFPYDGNRFQRPYALLVSFVLVDVPVLINQCRRHESKSYSPSSWGPVGLGQCSNIFVCAFSSTLHTAFRSQSRRLSFALSFGHKEKRYVKFLGWSSHCFMNSITTDAHRRRRGCTHG